jgi:formylglycine-generating enzyme required for sulfatase activity
MKSCCAFTILLLISQASVASDITVEGVEWMRNDASKTYSAKFTLSWNNSWNNEYGYDAAWIFIKYQSQSLTANYRHARISGNGHRLLINHIPGSPNPAFEIPEDRTGFFIYPSTSFRGNIRWTIEIPLDITTINDQNFNVNDRYLEVFAIEMVYVPQGAFTLGDPDTVAYRNFSLFAADGSGRPAGLYTIRSEKAPINVGPEKGNLYYNAEVPLYHGDRRGPIPADFPKGFAAFYIMKYETTQGQYADFLNSISPTASQARANFGGKDYYENRGTIRFTGKKYVAGSPLRPNNFFSWDDACAFADWSGLRPFTELEFEKACRGPKIPIAHEYPWNTDNKNKLQRVINADGDLVWLNGLKEADLREIDREKYGASFYWVMDLAGSLWERCITIGDSTGRAFKGTHGDGQLTGYGFANNADWPKGSTETAGFGFKGGGYYEHQQLYGPFNPHGPIGYRNFAAWPGGARSVAYGSRFVRTAAPK